MRFFKGGQCPHLGGRVRVVGGVGFPISATGGRNLTEMGNAQNATKWILESTLMFLRQISLFYLFGEGVGGGRSWGNSPLFF